MRLVAVRLARPELKIHLPGSDLLLAGERRVDLETPYWAGHFRDGSIVRADPPSTSPPPFEPEPALEADSDPAPDPDPDPATDPDFVHEA